MMAFVVQYRPHPEAELKVSQEAFWTLEEAQHFIESRANNPGKCSNYYYQTPLFEEYYISEVSLRDRKGEEMRG